MFINGYSNAANAMGRNTPRSLQNTTPILHFQGRNPVEKIEKLNLGEDIELRERLLFAVRTAQEAGRIIMRYYGMSNLKIERKSKDESPVTLADQKADALIRQRIGTRFPKDAIITEESFTEGALRSLKEGWIVDPLDGTTNFTTRTGPFAVSMAYLHEGKPVVGVIWDPRHRELFTAIEGKGAFLNGKPIHVNPADQFSRGTIVSTFTPPPKGMAEVRHTSRRLGCTATDVCYVADGRMVAACEQKKITSWDVAAAMVILKEAGGKITDLEGKELDLNQDKLSYLATNTKFHDRMLALIH